LQNKETYHGNNKRGRRRLHHKKGKGKRDCSQLRREGGGGKPRYKTQAAIKKKKYLCKHGGSVFGKEDVPFREKRRQPKILNNPEEGKDYYLLPGREVNSNKSSQKVTWTSFMGRGEKTSTHLQRKRGGEKKRGYDKLTAMGQRLLNTRRWLILVQRGGGRVLFPQVRGGFRR